MCLVRHLVLREADIPVNPVSHIFKLLPADLGIHIGKARGQLHRKYIERVVRLNVTGFVCIEPFPVIMQAQVIQKIQDTPHTETDIGLYRRPSISINADGSGSCPRKLR